MQAHLPLCGRQCPGLGLGCCRTLGPAVAHAWIHSFGGRHCQVVGAYWSAHSCLGSAGEAANASCCEHAEKYVYCGSAHPNAAFLLQDVPESGVACVFRIGHSGKSLQPTPELAVHGEKKNFRMLLRLLGKWFLRIELHLLQVLRFPCAKDQTLKSMMFLARGATTSIHGLSMADPSRTFGCREGNPSCGRSVWIAWYGLKAFSKKIMLSSS